jgi:predicted transporter
MAYRGLIIGLLFSIGIFAVKSGVGMAYALARQPRRTAKAGLFGIFASAYLLVFALSAFVLVRIDLLNHLAAIRAFIQSGMLVHLAMAIFLAVWGVLLLGNVRRCREKTRGWLMLVMPCPVCIMVIFLSSGFLITCFPDASVMAVAALFGAFILINLLTAGVVAAYGKGRGDPPEFLLGGAMLLMAVYFLISVTVMPQFADVEKIYRLALYQGRRHSHEVQYILPFSILVAVAFAGGFGFRMIKGRGKKELSQLACLLVRLRRCGKR